MSLDILERIEQIRQELDRMRIRQSILISQKFKLEQELYELEYVEDELKDELIELEMRAGLKKEDGD